MYHYVSISIKKILYSIYSKVPVILPITWKEIGTHFDDIGRETVPIQGDGFCFITSLVKAMKSEHNIILEKSEAQDLIIDQVIENYQQYSLYHYNKTLTQKESLNNTDSFMSELINFFDSRDFTHDVVNLIIQIAADALGLNIYIYQENILQKEENSTEESHTEVIKMSGGQLCKDVYMKFIHNNINVQGNHHEPLLKTEE